jgi:Mrp family chromosome partitioning ATPase
MQVAIASGKGGTGKTLLATNLAAGTSGGLGGSAKASAFSEQGQMHALRQVR